MCRRMSRGREGEKWMDAAENSFHPITHPTYRVTSKAYPFRCHRSALCIPFAKHNATRGVSMALLRVTFGSHSREASVNAKYISDTKLRPILSSFLLCRALRHCAHITLRLVCTTHAARDSLHELLLVGLGSHTTAAGNSDATRCALLTLLFRASSISNVCRSHSRPFEQKIYFSFCGWNNWIVLVFQD